VKSFGTRTNLLVNEIGVYKAKSFGHGGCSRLPGIPRPEIPNDLAALWRRSMALGISPDQHSPRHLHDATDVLELRPEHRLQQIMPALNDLLADDSRSGRHLLVLADTSGEVLWRVGSPDVLRRADRLESSEGADWSEAGIGTNAISEALVTGQPVQLFSAEHLVRTHRRLLPSSGWSSSGTSLPPCSRTAAGCR
jgi:transcriptional regulator of acetoin/glycerol metabolism